MGCGALFPFELFAKIGPHGGIYKENIIEFYFPSKFFQDPRAPIAVRSLLGRGMYFLLVMLPISCLVPAIWEYWTKETTRDGRPRPSFVSRWMIGMAMAVGLTTFATLSLPLAGTPDWLSQAGRTVPAGFFALGVIAAAFVVWRSPVAALLSACAGVALAGGLPWLQGNMLGNSGAFSVLDIGPITWPSVAGLAAVVALLLTLHAGARLFHVLLAIAFGYLALQAIRNANIFGLIAGFVLASGLGDWAAKVFARGSETVSWQREWCGAATRVVMAGLIAIGAVRAAAGQLATTGGRPFALGLRETPSTFAHEASRFAGRPGMPMRACL